MEEEEIMVQVQKINSEFSDAFENLSFVITSVQVFTAWPIQ